MVSAGVRKSSIVAPFADMPIELSMLSITSSRYKTYYCVECNHPFLQRDDETIYRINTSNEPSRAWFDSGGSIIARCGACGQKYVGYIAVTVMGRGSVRSNEVVSHITQSIYLQAATEKHERYIRCFDCGHSFCELNDRISKVVDNCTPLEYVPIAEVGIVKLRCKYPDCRQHWALMV